MAAPNGRIESGQSLESAISARAWNRAQDAADIVLGAGAGMAGQPARSASAPYYVMPCKNYSSSDIPRFGVVEIGNYIPAPASESDPETLQFLSQPLISASAPPTTTAKAFGIAIDPIGAGKVGRVAVSGVCQVRIEIVDDAHWLATAKMDGENNGTFEEMQSSKYYGIPILWKESGTGSGKWAIVLLEKPTDETPVYVLGKISETSTKGGESVTVDRYNGDGSAYDEDGQPSQISAKNLFATVTVNSGGPAKWVGCRLIGGAWYIVAAEC
jgi:hypothetical protein